MQERASLALPVSEAGRLDGSDSALLGSAR